MLRYQKIPGFAYSIDTDGRIWGLLDNVPVPHQTRDDGVYVTLKFLGAEVQLNLAILVLLTFAINNRDVGMLDFIVPMFKNGDNTDCKLNNLTYRFKPKPFIDDYYLIPFYTNYLVNKEGVVIRASDGMKLTPHLCKSGYLNYGLRRDLGFIEGTKQSTVGAHRLIALALLQYPVNVDELMVNHIDGIKLNNFVDNFEWVTPKENIVHAVVNGLRSDNQPVLYRDLLKKIEVETYSISECARILGVPHNVIIQRLKKPGQPIWPGGLQFKLKSDPTPWREPLDLISELKSMKSATSIKVFNIQSGEISVHPDATKAGEYTGVNPSTVKWQLNKAKVELPIHGFLFRYEWDKRDLPTFTEFQLMCFAANPKDPPTPVCCFDMVTSIETLYTSVTDASMKLGINPNTIKTCIRSTRPFSKRYKFMYVDLLTLEPIPRK